MSTITYRGNLSAKTFPFLTDFHGQTVIVPGNDNTFNRSLVSPEDLDRDVGVPSIYYCHNVLPAPYGFTSVGYTQQIPPVSPASTLFTGVKVLKSNAISTTVAGPQYYFSPQISGVHNVLLLGGISWSTISNTVAYTSTTVITYATCQGISYIFFSGIGCYKYDSATNTLVAVTLTGLVAANIQGIVSYQGYIIAFDTKTVYWSSAIDIDPTLNSVDFVPSLITGAGSFTLEGAASEITFILPATFGVMAYTKTNAVSGIYSNNPRYPFTFKEVTASGGCVNQNYVAYDANSNAQYVYTTSGFQIMSAMASQTIFPELTDFLGGRDFEDFNETTLTFTHTALTSPMIKRVTAVSDRYLIVSYGMTELTHALVYDMVQKRYGKLKITHVECFEYIYFDPELSDAPKNSIGFLKSDGSMTTLDMSLTLSSSNGTIILGKFQYDRGHLLTLEELTIQTIHPTQSVAAYDMPSLTGGAIESVTYIPGYETSVSGDSQRHYKFHTVGKNHSILLVGGFSLSSFVLQFHADGRR